MDEPCKHMLSEKNWTQNWNIIWLYICKIIRTEKFMKTESWLVISRGRDWRNKIYYLILVTKYLFWVTEKFRK